MTHKYMKIHYTILILPLCILLFTSQAHADLPQYSRDGNLAKIQEVVEQGADVNTKNKLGNTALDYAHINKRQSVVNYLQSKQ